MTGDALTMTLMPLVAFLPILALTAWSDLRSMTIPNRLVGAGLVVLLPFALLLEPSEVLARLAVAGGVLAFSLAAFAARLMGGGDAKMLPVMALCIPGGWLAEYLLVFAASILVSLVAIALARRFATARAGGLVALRAGSPFPLGVPIALSGLLLLGALFHALQSGG